MDSLLLEMCAVKYLQLNGWYSRHRAGKVRWANQAFYESDGKPNWYTRNQAMVLELRRGKAIPYDSNST